MISRPLGDTVVRREGTNSVTNAKRKNKTETNTLATFSTTSFNQSVWQGKGKTCWEQVILRAALLQSFLTHCICTVIIVINQDTWKQ